MTLRERFNDKWIEDKGGCWVWVACTDKKGYGKLKVSGQMKLAHRVSWELHRGEIPVGDDYHGVCVLHKCDNPPCVNPEHLFLGTNRDNIDDMINKGRAPSRSGEKNGRAKLTTEQVLNIKSDQRIQREIAADYGIAPSMVSMIKTGTRWKHR